LSAGRPQAVIVSTAVLIQKMRRFDLQTAWTQTPWGTMWAFALIVGACGIVACLVEGWTLGTSVIFGLLIGPGWLAVLTCAALIYWAFGGRGTRYP
jgi:hypothetical protein